SEMLVHKACRDEIVDAALETRRADVAVNESIVDISAAGDLQHLGRQINTVESSNAPAPKPGTGSAGAASEVSNAFDGCPRDRLERLEEHEVHLVLYCRFIRREPLAVTLPYGDEWIATSVEVRELEHCQLPLQAVLVRRQLDILTTHRTLC